MPHKKKCFLAAVDTINYISLGLGIAYLAYGIIGIIGSIGIINKSGNLTDSVSSVTNESSDNHSQASLDRSETDFYNKTQKSGTPPLYEPTADEAEPSEQYSIQDCPGCLPESNDDDKVSELLRSFRQYTDPYEQEVSQGTDTGKSAQETPEVIVKTNQQGILINPDVELLLESGTNPEKLISNLLGINKAGMLSRFTAGSNSSGIPVLQPRIALLRQLLP